MTESTAPAPQTLRELVQTRFGGKLTSGRHVENGEACILEARNVLLGNKWSDSPLTAGRPDIRRLNDSYTDDARRTEAMLRLDEAFTWWPDAGARQIRFVQLLAIATVQEVVSELPGLPEELRAKCRAAASLSEAQAAAAAAAAAAADDAAAAAAAAADAAAADDAAAAARWAAAAAAADDAAAARWAAAAAAAADARWAARWAAAAADAAAAARWAAADAAARHDTLDKIVSIWIRCAGESAQEAA